MTYFYTSAHVEGNNIFLRGYRDGKRFSQKIFYRPYLFMRSSSGGGGEYRAIDGTPVERVDFESIAAARGFLERYDGVENATVYGMTSWLYPFLNDEFADLEYDATDIVVLNYDIEVHSDDGFPDPIKAEHEITAITMRCKGITIVLGQKPYIAKSPNVRYILCADEEELLSRFVDEWTLFDPDVITGWNIDEFDNVYVINRLQKVLPERWTKLSPWGKIKARKVHRGEEGEYDQYDIIGVESLDYIQCYKKFRMKMRESYRLDYIAHVELNKRKLDYSEYASLQNLYRENYERYIDYNIQDVALVNELDEKLGFIEQIYAIAYDSRVLLRDAFTSVNLWDVIIHNHLMKQKIVVPPKGQKKKGRQIVGGHVKEVQPGLYQWVVSFDLTSLYPHLIMEYNISPEKFVGFYEPLHIDDDPEAAIPLILEGRVEWDNTEHVMTAGGAMFLKDAPGFLPELMEQYYQGRSVYKKKMLAEKQVLVSIEEEMERRGMDVKLYKAKL